MVYRVMLLDKKDVHHFVANYMSSFRAVDYIRL
jgi:hypothetical protein